MDTKEKVEGVNRGRRKVQEGKQEEMRGLEAEWVRAVRRGVEVGIAVGGVEAEIGEVRRG